jgi:pimeloyl-ACP methyl ester carboxylesterase
MEKTEKQEMTSSRRDFLAGVAALGAAALAGCASMGESSGNADAGSNERKSGFVTLKDKTQLHYLEQGRGQPLVLIPGWSQTAAMFDAQLNGLSSRYRVIALDMRGHGESSKPNNGYRIARMAQDTHEFLEAMNLRNVCLGGHSMGCSVIWSYWEHYGNDRIAKLVLIDQAAAVVIAPIWVEEEKVNAGAFFAPQALWDTASAIAGPNGVQTTEQFVNNAFFTPAYPRDKLAWVLMENLKLPRHHAARLLCDHCSQDWRDTIQSITIPAVVFGGEKSFFNPKSQEWIAKQIPGSRVHIYTEAEGGSHFMFMENPDKFNQQVIDFLG